MKYVLGTFEKDIIRREAANIPLLKYQRIVVEMGKILFAATDEIINNPNLKALRDQQIDHVASNKPGTAGDDRNRTSHVIRRPTSSSL